MRSCRDVVEFFNRDNTIELDFGKYEDFVRRQLEKHKDYDLEKVFGAERYPLYFNVMADKVLLFSYLIGEMDITAGYERKSFLKKIKSVDDLYLLRPAEIGHGDNGCDVARKTDKKLSGLLGRIKERHRKYRLPNWGEHINEIGEDINVINRYGRMINYKMVLKCCSPNPFTYGWGGCRHRKV